MDDPGWWQREDREQLGKAVPRQPPRAASTSQPTPPRPLHLLIVRMQVGVVAPDTVVLIVTPAFYERAVKKKLLPSWPPANLFLCS